MPKVVRFILLLTVGWTLLGCPINHWSERRVLEDQGYEEIYFGEVPGEPKQSTFFARRAGQVCTGIIDMSGEEPQIRGRCRPPGGENEH